MKYFWGILEDERFAVTYTDSFRYKTICMSVFKENIFLSYLLSDVLKYVYLTNACKTLCMEFVRHEVQWVLFYGEVHMRFCKTAFFLNDDLHALCIRLVKKIFLLWSLSKKKFL